MTHKDRQQSGKIKTFFIFILSAVVIGLALLVSVFLYYSRQIPDPSVISARRVSESTKIFDNTGELILYNIHGQERRTIVPWEDMPDSLKNATLAAEDADFYTHSGLDFRGIVRAFFKNVKELGISQGGSTITQQLIKNSLLGHERTFSRKIREIVLSIEVERKFTKDEIFWMYLNQIDYGSNSYGVEAASQTFFGKSVKKLSLSESALLASLPKATTYYSPYGNNYTALIARRDSILESMLRSDVISQDKFEKAINDALEFQPPRETIAAPHFVFMVRDYLIKKYGEDTVENGGLRVITTLNSKLQIMAEESINNHSEDIEKRFKASNAALVALDPRTGKILAMVGSRDYFDIENEGNFNVATALRQPGSAFKPFAYLTALDNGFTDSTIVFDLLTEFNPRCEPGAFQEEDRFGLKCYHPRNYSGTFRGPVTLRQALSQSLNIPSVKVLHLAGIQNTINNATNMGITSLTRPDRYGLSLVLGGAEVKLMDIVAAYGVLANEGIKNPSTFIEKIVTSDGVVLEEYRKDEDRVVDQQIAIMINDILSDNISRAPVFGSNNYLFLPDRPIAAKTGTTQENRDTWLIGFTPSLVAGVWTGNNDNSRMTDRAAGATVAGPIWNEFMRKALENTPVEEFSKPSPVFVNKTMLNGRYTSPRGIHSILYYVDKNNPQGAFPSDPRSESQFDNWEGAVAFWVQRVFAPPASKPLPSLSPSPLPNPEGD